MAGQTSKVDYKAGATVMSGNFWNTGSAVTIGSYIHGNSNLKPDFNNWLFQHEYGHYLQSQEMGTAYLITVGIPSILSPNDDMYDYQDFEQDANRRAFLYFNEKVKGFYQTEEQYNENISKGMRKGWNFDRNPLALRGNERGRYYDYYMDGDEIRKELRLQAGWGDIMFGIMDPLFGTIFGGLGNAF